MLSSAIRLNACTSTVRRGGSTTPATRRKADLWTRAFYVGGIFVTHRLSEIRFRFIPCSHHSFICFRKDPVVCTTTKDPPAHAAEAASHVRTQKSVFFSKATMSHDARVGSIVALSFAAWSRTLVHNLRGLVGRLASPAPRPRDRSESRWIWPEVLEKQRRKRAHPNLGSVTAHPQKGVLCRTRVFSAAGCARFPHWPHIQDRGIGVVQELVAQEP